MHTKCVKVIFIIIFILLFRFLFFLETDGDNHLISILHLFSIHPYLLSVHFSHCSWISPTKTVSYQKKYWPELITIYFFFSKCENTPGSLKTKKLKLIFHRRFFFKVIYWLNFDHVFVTRTELTWLVTFRVDTVVELLDFDWLTVVKYR